MTLAQALKPILKAHGVELHFYPPTGLYSIREAGKTLGLRDGWETSDRAQAVQYFWLWAQCRRKFK